MKKNTTSSQTETAASQASAQVLVLRTSQEVLLTSDLTGANSSEAVPSAELLERRARAAQLWQKLSSDPASAEPNAKQQSEDIAKLQLELTTAKKQLLDYEQALDRSKEWDAQHLAVYWGGAALLGATGLWLFERRQRISLQNKKSLKSSGLNSQENLKQESLRKKKLSKFSKKTLKKKTPDSEINDSNDTSLKPEPPHFDLATHQAVSTTNRTSFMQMSERVLGNIVQRKQAEPESITPEFWESKSSTDSFLPSQSDTQFLVSQSSAPAGLEDADWDTPSARLVTPNLAVHKAVNATKLESTRVLEATTSSIPAPTPAHESHVSVQIPPSPAVASMGLSSTTLNPVLNLSDSLVSSKIESEQSGDPFEATSAAIAAEAMPTPLIASEATASSALLTPASSVARERMEVLLELRTLCSGLIALNRPLDACQHLQTHIERDPQTCAWVYLECMHWYEQAGTRNEFEILRTAYRSQFNRLAPYWKEPNSDVLGIDGYSRAVGELTGAWQHRVADDLILTWMFGPVASRRLLQRPAFHDLMDLYEVLAYAKEPEGMSQPQDAARFTAEILTSAQAQHPSKNATADDFIPTVSLLDLDYEFSVDMRLDAQTVEQAETSVVSQVKTNNLQVDVNFLHSKPAGLFTSQAPLGEK